MINSLLQEFQKTFIVFLIIKEVKIKKYFLYLLYQKLITYYKLKMGICCPNQKVLENESTSQKHKQQIRQQREKSIYKQVKDQNTSQQQTQRNKEQTPPIEQDYKEILNSTLQNSATSSFHTNLSNQANKILSCTFNGLPNIGNTCYLNSILQLLFSAEKLRKLIVKLTKNSKLIFHRYVANIFGDIEKKVSFNTKTKHLQMLIQYIESKNPSFMLFKQNDALQCLLQILNLLEQEDSTNSKLKYFEIRYQPRCSCIKPGQNFILQSYFVKSSEVCSNCNKSVKYLIHSTGPYLIVMPSSSYTFHNNMKLHLEKNSCRFRNMAFITYYGNKISGHYITHRRIKQGWIQISDSSVKFIGKLDETEVNPMITLYQFDKKIYKQ